MRVSNEIVKEREGPYLPLTSLRYCTQESTHLLPNLPEATNVASHSTTIGRHLVKPGLSGRTLQRKPLLIHENKQNGVVYT